MPKTTVSSFRIPTYVQKATYNGSTGVYSYTDTPGSIPRDNTRTVGDNYPDWRDRIYEGREATTDLNANRWFNREMRPGTLQYIPGPLWTSTSNCWKYWELENIPFKNTHTSMAALETSATNMAKVQFLRALNKYQRPLQGGVILGEARETVRLIKKPAKALRDGLDSYVRTVKKRTKGLRLSRDKLRQQDLRRRVDRIISETWLEYVFGWLPLVNDIKDAGLALVQYENNRLEPLHIHGRGVARNSVHPTTLVNRTWGYCKYHYNTRLNLRVEVILKAGVRLPRLSETERLLRLTGFTLEDFVPTVWELIPYSFLVDYFVNIGDIINAYSYGKFEKTYACITVRKEVENMINTMFINRPQAESNVASGLFLDYIFLPQQTKRVYTHVDRTIWDQNLIPTLEFSIPENPFKYLNIGALAILKSALLTK